MYIITYSLKRGKHETLFPAPARRSSLTRTVLFQLPSSRLHHFLMAPHYRLHFAKIFHFSKRWWPTKSTAIWFFFLSNQAHEKHHWQNSPSLMPTSFDQYFCLFLNLVWFCNHKHFELLLIQAITTWLSAQNLSLTPWACNYFCNKDAIFMDKIAAVNFKSGKYCQILYNFINYIRVLIHQRNGECLFLIFFQRLVVWDILESVDFHYVSISSPTLFIAFNCWPSGQKLMKTGWLTSCEWGTV